MADGPRPSVAGPDEAWTTAPCPGLGADRHLFARAVLLDDEGLPGREFENSSWAQDDRAELAALAAGTLDRVAAKAGCQVPAGQVTGTPPYPRMPEKRPGFPGTPADPLCMQAKHGAGKGVPPEQPESARSWAPEHGTSQGAGTTPVASCDLAVAGGSARQTITTFRSGLLTIGTDPAGAREELLTGKRLNNTFSTRTEAVCGGERVAWTAELEVFGKTRDAKDVEAANAEAQAQFKAFVDLNVRDNGCQVTSSGTGVSR